MMLFFLFDRADKPKFNIFLDFIYTGCLYKLSRINLLFGPLKCSKSNFNPVHVFLHFNSFCLVVLKLILALKLSELEQFENRDANYQLASIKGGNEAKKTCTGLKF